MPSRPGRCVIMLEEDPFVSVGGGDMPLGRPFLPLVILIASHSIAATPPYDVAAVGRCARVFEAISGDPVGAVKAKYPCALDLIRRFKSQDGGSYCPSSCVNPLRVGISDRMGGGGANPLMDVLFPGCGQAVQRTWEASGPFRGAIAFDRGDLLYAFHWANFEMRGSALVDCRASDWRGCGCEGGASFEGRVTDMYDFCSSLPPGATPPWDDASWNPLPSPSSLAWCGCVLEDWYLKHAGEPNAGGRPFLVDCPIRAEFPIRGEFGE